MRDVQAHAFFGGVDWAGVADRTVPAPFVPEVASDTDVRHFGGAIEGEEDMEFEAYGWADPWDDSEDPPVWKGVF